MKIKDKIIHLLGGYTKDEYGIKAKMPVIKCERPLVKLKAGYRLPYYITEPSDEITEDVKCRLSAMLANKMLEENLIVFQTEEDNPMEIYASVFIAKQKV